MQSKQPAVKDHFETFVEQHCQYKPTFYMNLVVFFPGAHSTRSLFMPSKQLTMQDHVETFTELWQSALQAPSHAETCHWQWSCHCQLREAHLCHLGQLAVSNLTWTWPRSCSMPLQSHLPSQLSLSALCGSSPLCLASSSSVPSSLARLGSFRSSTSAFSHRGLTLLPAEPTDSHGLLVTTQLDLPAP